MTKDEIRKRLARIDQLTADSDLQRQEFALGYRKFWASATAAAVALFSVGMAIGVAIVKL